MWMIFIFNSTGTVTSWPSHQEDQRAKETFQCDLWIANSNGATTTGDSLVLSTRCILW